MKRKQLLHKSMAVLTALTLMATAFTGCGSGSATKQDDSAQSTDAEARMLITEQMGRIRLHLNRRRTWCSH